MKTIRITCEAADTVPMDKIQEFQGELKNLEKDQYQQLKMQIEKHGFAAPIFIWRNEGKFKCLDGHQRLRVLKTMKEVDDYDIPNLPVAWIDAKDEKEAKHILLGLTSQYGNMTDQGLYQFVIENEITPLELKENYHFDSIDLEKFEDSFFKDAEVPEDAAVDKIEENYSILVSCDSEQRQTELLDEFKNMGIKCRALIS